MRWAVALGSAIALAGCASSLLPTAWLDVHDAAKVGDSFVVRFSLTNGHATTDLDVQRDEFWLEGGRGLSACTDRASAWDLLDLRADADHVAVAPGDKLEGYLEFGRCPGVEPPYTLLWNGDKKSARDAAEVRLLGPDAPLSPMEVLARSLDESARLG